MTGTRAYLDHAATTPMLPAAQQAWLEAAGATGNPSSLHAAGRAARRIVEESRERIAAALRTRPSAIVFTAGGTEADNLAVKGLAWQRPGGAVLASAIEHHAVLDPVAWLAEHDHVSVTWLEPDAVGRIHPATVERAIIASTDAGTPVALCTVMWANNEVGTVAPVEAIARVCRAHGVPFHTDAVQALGQLDLDLGSLMKAGATAVTVTSHKVGGPFGVGALIVDPSTALTPLLHGGGQEREVRSGTLDAPAIAGFAAAVEHAVEHRAIHAREIAELRDVLVTGVLDRVPAARLNGDPEPAGRLPGNAHFTFADCEGDMLLMLLDAAGIDCSTGSACTAGIPEPSHVLLAMGADERAARGSLRFSLGRTSTQADVDAVLAALPGAVERAARAGSAGSRQ